MSSDPGPIKLMLVDDHELLRLGLKALFGAIDRFDVVGEAATAEEAVAVARRVEPDIVIMDVRLPDGSGVEACRDIRSERPEVRVLMLTTYADEDAVVASVMAGAAGYLLKQTDPRRLVAAVDTVRDGGSLLDPEATGVVLSWMRRLDETHQPDPLAALSSQEHKILLLIAEGRSNREIGQTLFLSENTVKTYVSNILQKLHLARRGQAAALVTRRRHPSQPLDQ